MRRLLHNMLQRLSTLVRSKNVARQATFWGSLHRVSMLAQDRCKPSGAAQLEIFPVLWLWQELRKLQQGLRHIRPLGGSFCLL